MDDAELIDRIVALGDEEAARALVSRYKSLVYGTFRRIRQFAPDDCDDLFQVFFEKLWEDDCRRLRRWHGGSLAAYFRSMARHLALDELRRRQPPSGDDPDEDLPDSDPHPETLAMIAELRRMLMEAVGRLGEGDRLAIQTVDLEDGSYELLAARLGCNRNAAGVRLHRAHQRLAEIVRREYPALGEYLGTWV